MSLHTDKSGAMSIGKVRHYVVLEALWEIEALCDVLIGVDTRDASAVRFTVRGLASRMQGLSRAGMCALSDEDNPTAELYKEVLCTMMPEEQEHQS